MPAKKITIYGTGWCPKTSTLKHHLHDLWVEFELKDIDKDAEANEELLNLMDGKRYFPVVKIDEKVLLNPRFPELKKEVEG